MIINFYDMKVIGLFIVLCFYFPIILIIGIYCLFHLFLTGNNFTNTKFVKWIISPIIYMEKKCNKKV